MRTFIDVAKLVAAVLAIVVSPPIVVYAGPFGYGIASDVVGAAPTASALAVLAVAGLIAFHARRRTPAQAAAKSIT